MEFKRSEMTWKPSHEPVRYDRARVAQLKPLQDAVGRLGLPPLRLRKLRALLGALEAQIEDGGDSPEVNALLLDALHAGVRHQVDDRAAQGVRRAIGTFAQAEEQRWMQVRAGTLPPIELTPEEQLDDLMQDGYRLQQAGNIAAACDRWLAAWELIRRLARPDMRTSFSFSRSYGTFQSVFNWSSDIALELGNAGTKDPAYYEHLLRFSREYLAQFPDEDQNHVLNMLRSQGEALWFLGRRAEAEAVYAALVERLPDEGFGYIGWADHYWLYRDSPKEYARAVAILQRALARRALRDREHVLDRLAKLYSEWGRPDAQAAVLAQRAQGGSRRQQQRSQPLAGAAQPAPPDKKPGRNEPCWCGSGKKYKRCHLDADASTKR
jgi:tetratricopeptide (TPR) repeat protein